MVIYMRIALLEFAMHRRIGLCMCIGIDVVCVLGIVTCMVMRTRSVVGWLCFIVFMMCMGMCSYMYISVGMCVAIGIVVFGLRL